MCKLNGQRFGDGSSGAGERASAHALANRVDREAAEKALHTTATGVPGFIVMLLKIAASDGDGAPDAVSVKQAAALALKNAARRNWDPRRFWK